MHDRDIIIEKVSWNPLYEEWEAYGTAEAWTVSVRWRAWRAEGDEHWHVGLPAGQNADDALVELVVEGLAEDVRAALRRRVT